MWRLLPPAKPIFDHAEYTIGLGFAAFQTYLTAVRGARSKDCLDVGPQHRCGKTFARICNEIANYWKHHGEWKEGGDGPHLQLREVFDALRVNIESEYVASRALRAIVSPLPMTLATVVPFLVQWAESVEHVSSS